MNKFIYLLFYSDEYSDKFVAAYSNYEDARAKCDRYNTNDEDSEDYFYVREVLVNHD